MVRKIKEKGWRMLYQLSAIAVGWQLGLQPVETAEAGLRSNDQFVWTNGVHMGEGAFMPIVSAYTVYMLHKHYLGILFLFLQLNNITW